ncbi:MAG: hypothetical protein U1F98_04615 [Verrucomicrobiota bacterium]
MKFIVEKALDEKGDFYTTTLAPITQPRTLCCVSAADVVMLTVLFLELAAVMRFLLAK